jgi:hypothetical protein
VVAEAIVRLLSDLVPADNTLPMDAALAWSRRDWERQEAAARSGGRAATLRPSHADHTHRTRRPVPLLKLEESNDDELYRPTLPHGDPGHILVSEIPNTPNLCNNVLP